MKLVGIEIGGTKVQVALGNECGEVEWLESHGVRVEQGAAEIRAVIESKLRGLGQVDGIGVGFGGPVDSITGEVFTSFQVDGWAGVNLRNWLQQITEVPVVIDNDANVAALAEAVVGVGRGQRVVFYVTLGSGVGSGLVWEGRVYHGARPGELEFGHVRLGVSGRTVESSCSGWAVNRKVVAYSQGHERSRLAQVARTFPGTEAMALMPAIADGDEAARFIVDETAKDLAFGLSHVVHLLHPDIVVLGGGLSLMGEYWREAVASKLQGFLMEPFRGTTTVALSELKVKVVPIGALMMIGDELKKIK